MALYACPNCKCEHRLVIELTTDGLLVQGSGVEFETELLNSDQWWDDNSKMSCMACLWEGTTSDGLKENQNA